MHAPRWPRSARHARGRTRYDGSWLLLDLHDFPHLFLDIAPGGCFAEIRAQISDQIGDLLGGERTGKGRHPAAAFTLWRRNALQDDADQIARRWIGDGRTQREMQCTA